MSSIAKSINLKEITIENNPISLAGDCVSFLVSYLPLLNSLNQLQITEQVRRAANAWRRNKENTDQNFQHLSTDVSSSIRREEIISNAKTNWELIRQSNIAGQRLNSQAKKSIIKPKLTSSNSISSTSTASSSTTTNENKNKKCSIRQGFEQLKTQKSELSSSSSVENSNPMTSEKETDNVTEAECNLFHLPPVIDKTTESAASSTRPNIDSESSAFSSDIDDEKNVKSQIPTTPPITTYSLTKTSSPIEILRKEDEERSIIENDNKTSFTPPLPTLQAEIADSVIDTIEGDGDEIKDTMQNDLTDHPRETPSPLTQTDKEKAPLTIIDNARGISIQPTINIEASSLCKSGKAFNVQTVEMKIETIEADKLSIISKTSAKTSNESINTLSSAYEERQVHSSHTNYYPRNRSGTRKIGPPLVRSQTARNLSSQLNNQQNGPSNQTTNQKKEPKKETDKDREQGGDYLVEILGRYLNVYGVGAIKFVDKQWNVQKAQDVHTVKFSYINFNSISPILGRIKVRFPNVENYVFRETNFVCLGQLNAIADTQGLKAITIDTEGNPLTNKNWRTYAIYRLSHWGLKQINGVEITDDEIAEAESTYAGLADLVLWSLPDSLLQPLFTRLHVDETILTNKMTPKEWLMKHADDSIRNVVGKEALQWKKTTSQQDELAIRVKGKMYFSKMMENTVNAVEKLQKLEYLWQNVLLEMIRNTLIDYNQIDIYVRNLMTDILKDNEK
ncbi:CLUMA_CG012512, isoform A [Clunio marinus]|uniref:CLUMA_CG012512, isoform A n=1 Tax=Clunio marinus TaxID=568069 RepID=A0A1J1IG42_9DIPT|nr:CLUMA_CG012512, isoform A [Clunio marinus]